MKQPPAAGMPRRAADGVVRVATVMLGLLLGLSLQLWQASLSPEWMYIVALAAALALAALTWRFVTSLGQPLPVQSGWRLLGRWMHRLWWLCLALALAWGWAGWRAQQRLTPTLPTALEGVDLVVEGRVSSLPIWRRDGARFMFEVEAAYAATPAGPSVVTLPERLSLGWYRGWSRGSGASLAIDADLGPDPSLAAGQRWRLVLRLKRPHGALNPHGLDYELWLFEQGARATGYVRAGAAQPAQRLSDAPEFWRWRDWIERARQHVREALLQRLGDTPEAGLLAALSIGDQAAIERDDWDVFRRTGVAHLVAISGLHITMLAWLAAALVQRLWRQSARLPLRLPARSAAGWAGLVVALLYALFAGWGVPAQRTVCMLGVVALARSLGLRWPWPLLLSVAGLIVCLADPWALLQPGFWLSFVAVAVLMADGSATAQAPVAHPVSQTGEISAAPEPRWRLVRSRLGALLGAAVRTQVLATLVLAPLSMLFFHQVSVVGLLANLLAIPLVTLVITPLALLGVVLPALWTPAAAVAQILMDLLGQLSALPWASWQAAAAPGWAVVLAAAGMVVMACPLPLRLRALGLVLVLPLLQPAVQRPPPGEFELLVADIGQGNAVLVRTAHHALLYDAGPRYSLENDAGTRVLVPLLRALGDPELDLLMLSHRDIDHVGGAWAVLRGLDVARISSSLEPGHPLRAAAVHQPCAAGQRWQWDGVRFEVLHPPNLDGQVQPTLRPNTRSCVLRVASAQRAALLTGDIEREQELALVAGQGASSGAPAGKPAGAAALAADVLLVPHHGSKTSSSATLLDAVRPRWAMVQAGYRNRFGHPAPEVLRRYQERGIELVRSDQCGAWRWRSADGAATCEREKARRYWHAGDANAR